MRILIVSQYYWPEDFAAGVYIHELAETLAKRDHQVTVLTAFPHYPEGKIHVGYRHKLFQVQHKDGVRILRSFIYAVPRDRSLCLRSLPHLSFAFSALMAAAFTGGQDIAYIHMPVLPLGYVSLFISRLKRIPCVLGVKDMSAEALVQAGKLERGGRFRLIEKCERYLYKAADHVQVPGTHYKRRLIKWNIPESKITIIPDWADPSVIRSMPKKNEFRKSHGLHDKFVVLYSGNMGYSSDLETVIEAARELKYCPRIHFVLIGDGVKRAGLEQQAVGWGLANITFLQFQTRDVFPQVLAAADVCLLTLNRQFTNVAAQGKMYNIMSAGRPLLAVMDQSACGADLITTEQIGAVTPPGDSVALARIISEWQTQPELLETFGYRARRVLEERFSIEICVHQFEEMFKRTQFAT
jgi:colanic acid biosynthesis glycosyl transferase WcaI